MAIVRCPTHGLSGVRIYSSALLRRRPDGTLPEIVVIELKDTAEEEAFFRVNLTPEEAAALPVVDGRIPFDLDACDLMDRLGEDCSRCFTDRRRAIEREGSAG